MARARGVAAQAPGVGTIEFPKSRVAPARLENLKRAREARKVSYSMLVDELLARAIYDEQGLLVGLRPAAEQQELPLKTA